MNEHEITGILEFLRSAEKLKDTLRSAATSKGRRESTAEHTWRLCLMAMLLEKSHPRLNHHKLLKMCVIHDLGEALNGDIPAIEQKSGTDKGAAERGDLMRLIRPLPVGRREEILALWDEYEAASSPEARLAKALDKIETILQHTQGKNPESFNYGFNLKYGKEYTGLDEITSRLREIIDRDTEKLAKENGSF